MAVESPLIYERLRAAVTGDAAAIRCRIDLQPAGGPDDKVFPPTYAGGVYAFEKRRVGDREVSVVLLDSVQSQANRLELALQQAYDEGTLRFPLLLVDFSAAGIEGVQRITTLEAPHRIADAIFRDSEFKTTLFRDSDMGKRFAAARVENATAMFELCPTALIFGVWDSTGAAGGLGNKFARALVSEIVGYDVVPGVRTSSRIDPLAIEKCKIYEHNDSTEQNKLWTVNEEEALKDKDGKPAPFKRKSTGKGKAGKPSEINHGNVTPDIVRYAERVNAPDPLKPSDISINYALRSEDGDISTHSEVKKSDRTIRSGDIAVGGVTLSRAVQTTVLSLPALRRLRFPDEKGKQTAARNDAARTVLAALSLAAITYQRKAGYFLRSRCDLVPFADEVPFEIVTSATNVGKCLVNAELACKLFEQAVDEAKKNGMNWPAEEPIRLKPKNAFVQLVKRSRELAALEEEEDD